MVLAMERKMARRWRERDKAGAIPSGGHRRARIGSQVEAPTSAWPKVGIEESNWQGEMAAAFDNFFIRCTGARGDHKYA